LHCIDRHLAGGKLLRAAFFSGFFGRFLHVIGVRGGSRLVRSVRFPCHHHRLRIMPGQGLELLIGEIGRAEAARTACSAATASGPGMCGLSQSSCERFPCARSRLLSRSQREIQRTGRPRVPADIRWVDLVSGRSGRMLLDDVAFGAGPG
jgi:hypothetical protein